MKCLLFDCQNEARGTYPCCTQEHGVAYKMQKEQIQSCYNANESMKPWGVRELYTVEMAEHYEQT